MEQTSSNRSLSLSMCFWTNAQRDTETEKERKIKYSTSVFISIPILSFALRMKWRVKFYTYVGLSSESTSNSILFYSISLWEVWKRWTISLSLVTINIPCLLDYSSLAGFSCASATANNFSAVSINGMFDSVKLEIYQTWHRF